MEKNMCHCCLKISTYNDITTEYNSFERKKYSELIKDTFNIRISSQDIFVCKQCLKKLEDSSEFKKQIEKSQEELRKLLTEPQRIQGTIDESFKKENKLWEIDKNEANSNAGELMEAMKQNPMLNYEIDNKQEIIKIKKSTKELEEKVVTTKVIEYPKKIKNQRAIREDSLKLLKYSNICLFKSLKTKFQCYICKDKFINMSDLRSHTKIHYKPNSKDFKINLKGYSSKNADISSLTCNLCQQTCNDLKLLKKHLENKHNIEFSSSDHMFVPYKLENGFQCVTCGQNFNTFVSLSTHMNIHSTNNVCEICGVFFINRLSLRTHLKSVHKEKKCTLCTAKFEKSYAKVKHMKTVHNIGGIKRYCSSCGKDFRHSYLLTEHRIKEHGVKRQTPNCTYCGKTFLSPQNLRIHVRSVHFRERNFPCNVCGMRFFTKADEKRHARRHEDVKLFSCNHCEGKFKSKDSWKRHLKRIHNK